MWISWHNTLYSFIHSVKVNCPFIWTDKNTIRPSHRDTIRSVHKHHTGKSCTSCSLMQIFHVQPLQNFYFVCRKVNIWFSFRAILNPCDLYNTKACLFSIRLFGVALRFTSWSVSKDIMFLPSCEHNFSAFADAESVFVWGLPLWRECTKSKHYNIMYFFNFKII